MKNPLKRKWRLPLAYPVRFFNLDGVEAGSVVNLYEGDVLEISTDDGNLALRVEVAHKQLLIKQHQPWITLDPSVVRWAKETGGAKRPSGPWVHSSNSTSTSDLLKRQAR